MGAFMVDNDVESHEFQNVGILKAKMLSSFSNYFNELYDSFLNEDISLAEFIDNKNLFVDQWGFTRIDIKNQGDFGNSIKVINLDDDVTVSSAKWLTDETGEGFKVTSRKNKLRVTFRCVNAGELVLRFRGPEFRHILNKNRIPVKIFISDVKLNNETVLTDKLLWHDDSVSYTYSCVDGEIITMDIETKFIYDYFPSLLDLCNNIVDDDDFISSVNRLKKYFISNGDGNPKEFKDIYLDNHYLNQKYVELSRNDKSNIDDFMDSNKNLYDILNIVRREDSQILIQQFQEFLNVSSFNGAFDSNRFKNLLIYMSGRVDIINFGEDCDVELVYSSDNENNIRIPHWIKGGSGVVVESNKGILDVIVRFVGDGNLKLSFRSTDVRDKNKKPRLPIYIDFTDIKINGKPVLDERKLVTHNKPLNFNRKVKNGQSMSIHMEWTSFDPNNSSFE